MPKHKAKQAELKGMEAPVIKEIESAAEEYVAIRDKRMSFTEKEVSARTQLANAMHAHNLTSYRYDGKVVTVEPSEKGKVKAEKEPGEDDE